MSSLPQHLAELSPQERREHEADTLKILTADTIALLMEDLDVSQAELARRLGTSAANVSKLLSGSQNLRISTVATMCHALGVRMQPRLCPAPRAGTPAADDPPLPSWVGGHSSDFVTHVKLGHGDVPAATRSRRRARNGRSSTGSLPMRERLAGTLLLCDQLYEDRGKLSILGLPWNVTAPGKRRLAAVAIITVADPAAGGTVKMTLRLRRSDQVDKPRLLEGTIQGESAGDTEDHPDPHEQVIVPLYLPEVELEPSATYLLELIHEEEQLSSTTFRTSESDENEQSDDAEGSV